MCGQGATHFSRERVHAVFAPCKHGHTGYLVDYKIRYEENMELFFPKPGERLSAKMIKKARLWGSVFEQPALSETTEAFLVSLGPEYASPIQRPPARALYPSRAYFGWSL